jgi:hypothetical protein
MGGFTQDDGYVQGVAPMHVAPRNPSGFYRFSGALLAEPNFL